VTLKTLEGTVDWFKKPWDSGSAVNLLLLLISFVSLIPRLYVGSGQYIEYDGWWHVFIAKQDNWQIFLQSIRATAHPPLFYLLLKFACHWGSSRLVYRSVSLLTGAGTVFLIGKIAQKLSTHWLTPLLAATAFACSQGAIVMSCEVRSYMTCTFFMMLAFYYYLDLLRADEHDTVSRIGFVVATSLAVSSHYSALFFIATCAIAPVFIAIVNPDYRQSLKRQLTKKLLANFLTGLFIVAVMMFLFFFHARYYGSPLDYMADYFYQRGGVESVAGFLLRNLQNMFNLFLPVPVQGRQSFQTVLGAFGVITVVAMYWIEIRKKTRDAFAGTPLVFLLLLLGAVMVAAVLGKYPFGGYYRQQFLVFPFLVLGICLLLDWIPRPGKQIALVLGLAAVAWNARIQYEGYQLIRPELFAREMSLHQTSLPNMEAVYLDGYNIINFFIYYNDWKWHFDGPLPEDPWVYEYRLDKGPQTIEVFRDRRQWNFDLLDPSLYRHLSLNLRHTGGTICVFYIRQFVPDLVRTPEQVEQFKKQVDGLAAREHLKVSKLVLEGYHAFAAFQYSP
jgi:hypothetical protein